MGELQLYGITNLALGNGRSSLTPDDEHIGLALSPEHHCRVAGPVLRSERSRKRLIIRRPRALHQARKHLLPGRDALNFR